MPSGRILKYCVALSVLFHLAIAILTALIPVAPRPEEDVMVVDLADVPRATDFLPPKPGIIEGARPTPPPPPVRKEKPPELPRETMRGRVPDLPVNPRLAPEKEFPAAPAPREPQPPRPEENAQTARPGEQPARTARAAEPAKPPRPASPPNGARSAPRGGESKSLRDLTPGLGKTVMAMADRDGGRGENKSSGTATGTEAKARERGEIVEENGGGAHLTPLNAPGIQYISYFAGIKRKIELVWQYPYDALVANIYGELVIDFVIARDGRLQSLSLVAGSGHKILDEEAIRSIRVAAPFDPIPPDYDIPDLRIRAKFTYPGVSNVKFR